ncbi:MAG: transglycosylase domain-containing protein [Gemmatimonadetes bacterium]|nr:transglycosylase domain-containing protein [Gemmatimonadota bacterium]
MAGTSSRVLQMPVLRRWIAPALILVAALPVVTLAGLPWPIILRWANPPSTSFMLYRAREARRAREAFTLARDWVPLEEIPSVLVHAVLVSEDDRFLDHHGVDWKALGEEVHWQGGDTFSWWRGRDRAALRAAVRYAWVHRHEIKGRSTITQQLAKNLFFTPERSFLRKAEELVVARRLERFLSKDRILELYLNTVELGPGVFGVGAASRQYFGVPVQSIDRVQAASLAATLPEPLLANPAHRPNRMAWRRDLILQRLAGREVVIPAELPPADVPSLQPDSALRLVPDTVPASLDTAPAPPDTVSAHPDTLGAGPDTIAHGVGDTIRDTISSPHSPFKDSFR